MALEPDREGGRGSDNLVDVLEKVLDKGIVIDADISVAVDGTELLNVKIRAAIASLETAAEYGLEFPSGIDQEQFDEAKTKTTCPECGKKVKEEKLLNEMCPWCGWKSAKAKEEENEEEKDEDEEEDKIKVEAES